MRNGKNINNQGFSLVELIIVIAIMAILAGALAPQLIKYIDSSRKSADVSTGQSIATAVSVALANEAAYNDATGGITAGTSGTIWVGVCHTGSTDVFEKEVGEIIGADSAANTPKPKYNSSVFDDFAIVITKDDTTNNVSFAIYPADSTTFNETDDNSDDMVYPTVGDNYSN